MIRFEPQFWGHVMKQKKISHRFGRFGRIFPSTFSSTIKLKDLALVLHAYAKAGWDRKVIRTSVRRYRMEDRAPRYRFCVTGSPPFTRHKKVITAMRTTRSWVDLQSPWLLATYPSPGMILQVWYLMVMIFSTFPKRWTRKISDVGLTLFVKVFFFCEFWCSNLATPLDLASEVANCAASKHTFFFGWGHEFALPKGKVLLRHYYHNDNNNDNNNHHHHRHCHHGHQTNAMIVMVYIYNIDYLLFFPQSILPFVNERTTSKNNFFEQKASNRSWHLKPIPVISPPEIKALFKGLLTNHLFP